jgi:hypothetical protein
VTAAERLQEAEDRLEQLEDERDQLLSILRSIVGSLTELAILAGASPVEIDAALHRPQPQLQLLQGGAS